MAKKGFDPTVTIPQSYLRALEEKAHALRSVELSYHRELERNQQLRAALDQSQAEVRALEAKIREVEK